MGLDTATFHTTMFYGNPNHLIRDSTLEEERAFHTTMFYGNECGGGER